MIAFSRIKDSIACAIILGQYWDGVWQIFQIMEGTFIITPYQWIMISIQTRLVFQQERDIKSYQIEQIL